MTPNVNFMKLFSGWQAQNQPSVRFFSAFDDLTNLQNIIFSNLIPNPQQPPPSVNY